MYRPFRISPTNDVVQCLSHIAWLFDDLRRTCHSMVELIKKFIPHTNRRWVPRRFNQDPIESLFGQIRNLAGSNTDLDRSAVDMGMNEIRTLGLKNV